MCTLYGGRMVLTIKWKSAFVSYLQGKSRTALQILPV